MNFLLEDINAHFNKYLGVLSEKLIAYYGEEYRNDITEKINRTYYNFTSTPHEEYKYAKANRDEIDKKTMDIIKEKLRLFKQAELICRNNIKEKRLNYLQEIGFGNNPAVFDNPQFISLFSNKNFDKI